MMVQASRKLGIKLRVLAGSPEDSAAQEALKMLHVDVIFGKISQPEILQKFLSGLDQVAFESELIDIEALRAAVPARSSTAPKIRFVPELSVMAVLSEKLEQKKLLQRLNISMTPFREGPAFTQDLSPWLKSLQKEWGAFVLKWSKFGYDGRGVLMVPATEEGLKAALESATAAIFRGTRVYAEPKVKFVRELAIVVVQGAVQGAVRGKAPEQEQFRTYPLVVSEQKRGACHWVRGPAVQEGVRAEFEKQAQSYAVKLSQELGLQGTFAIEMFETADGELWVNEIAPRVHNTGHYSQEACNHDQFEMHLRAVVGAVTGEKLPELKCEPSFAMLNLLGPEGVQGRFKGLGDRLPQPPQGLSLHWYGKDDVFPGRKLGHVNVTAKSHAELQKRISELKEYEVHWTNFIKGLQS
jgi:5-(carboxyamino)imidazole ribonucleotide synthase